MKKSFILYMLISSFLLHGVSAQADFQKDWRNFPIVLSLQFHAISMPFRNLGSNFKNFGLGIGTEVSHNGSQNWVQQFEVVWFKNKASGNGIHLSTQAAWRPGFGSGVYGEVKAGIGYLIAKRPADAWAMKDGQWEKLPQGRKGKLTIPIGIGSGYYSYSDKTFVSPFVDYQVVFVSKYNASIPVMPQSLIQFGGRIHPNYSNTIID